MGSPNVFDMLPNEVFQLIFAAVADCKSLVRCMAVCTVFKQQSSRVASLSITCPGQFASYREKLKGIHAMTKEFPRVESLVVRVGHPKDEPPSWARCMRYAEVGASVEKFIFMAAKSGDFAEFDCAVGGGREFHEHGCESHERFGRADSATSGPSDNHNHRQNVHSSRINGHRGNGSVPFQRSELERNSQHFESNLTFRSNDDRLDVSPPRYEQEFVPNFHTRVPVTSETNSTTMQDATQSNVGVGNDITSILGREPAFVSRSFQDQTHSLLEHHDRNLNQDNYTLQDFDLRQVIAPSNDVLKRMVPVIVFAIIQGLDEFRDCIPKFIACFTKLKQFLLVDMVESVTIHMRDSHIEEIRLQYMHEKEAECIKRTCEEKMVFPRLAPIHIKSNFIDKRENHENYKDICNTEPQKIQPLINPQANKIIKELNINTYRSFASSSNTSNNTNNAKGSEMIEMKVDIDDFNNTHNNRLKPKIHSTCNVEDKYEAKVLPNCDIPNTKGKSPINNEMLEKHFEFEKNPNNSIKCKRCENLSAIGKNRPCWTCANKGIKIDIFEKKIRKVENIASNELFDNNLSNNALYKKEKTNEIKEIVQRFDSNRNTYSSQLRVFNNLFGTPKEVDLSNSSNPIILSTSTTNTNSSTETLENLENIPLLDIPSTSSNVLTSNQQKLEEIININSCGLRRSQSFDSIESLKDKEKCKEILNLQKERLGKEKNQKSRNHSYPQHYVRQILISNMDKSHNTNILKQSSIMCNQSELFKEPKYENVVDESLNYTRVEKPNVSVNAHDDATINIIQSPNDICECNALKSSIKIEKNAFNAHVTSANMEFESNLDQQLFLTSDKNIEIPNSCSKGFLNKLQERSQEQQNKATDNGHTRLLIKQQDCGLERLQNTSDMQREQQVQDEAIQLSVPRLEEHAAQREKQQETWCKQVGCSIRETQHEDHEKSEREKEACQEQLREGVRKQQREIEREALFFDISFWRTKQIVASKYSLSDVSMCIATHAAKSLTPVELNMLSRAALAGPLLVATIAHINKQVDSHNL